MIHQLSISFDLSNFVFTGIVYFPVTLLLGYLSFWFWKHRQQSELFKLLAYEAFFLSLVCLTGALAGTIFTHDPDGIFVMLVAGSFLLSISNAILGYLTVSAGHSKRSPWIVFFPILIYGFLVSTITLYAEAHPHVESNGGINWGLPLYVFLLRSTVYFVALVPVSILFLKKFQKSKKIDDKRFYLGLLLFFVFIILIVFVDFIIEPVFHLHALLSELAILIFAVVLFIIFFLLNEVFIGRIERRFRRMVEGMKSLVFIVGEDFEIRYSNPVVGSILGIDSDRLIGKSLLEFIHAVDKKLVKANYCFEDIMDKNIEFRIVDIKGNYHWVVSASHLVELEGVDGKEKRYLIVLKEISEIKELHYKLVEALKQAEESNRLKSAFLSNMSHEIRTPLNAVVGFSELLGYEITPEKRKYYSMLIGENVEQLIHLVNDIFDAAKLESNQFTVSTEVINLAKLLTQIELHSKQILEQSGKSGKIEIVFPGQGSGIDIHTDRERLGQIINILVNNAIKFTREGKIEVGYRISGDKDLLFWVRDTGIGISSDKGDLIFQIFSQVDDRIEKDFDGAGLGLGIAKRIIELLKGEIWFESVLGEGSIFYFTIPLENQK